MSSIGERIKEVRGGQSIASFSAQLGIHRNTLPNYESGDRHPDSAFLTKLCSTYKVEPTWLLLGEGPMYSVGHDANADVTFTKSADQDAIVQRAGRSPRSAAQGGDITDAVNVQELLNMTAEVLVSNTVYRPALAANIKAFHRSIALEHDNKELHSRIDIMEERMKAIEERMAKEKATQQKAANG